MVFLSSHCIGHDENSTTRKNEQSFAHQCLIVHERSGKGSKWWSQAVPSLAFIHHIDSPVTSLTHTPPKKVEETRNNFLCIKQRLLCFMMIRFKWLVFVSANKLCCLCWLVLLFIIKLIPQVVEDFYANWGQKSKKFSFKRQFSFTFHSYLSTQEKSERARSLKVS